MKPTKIHQPTRNAETAIAELISTTRGTTRREFLEWITDRISLSDFTDLQNRYLSDPDSIKYMIKYLDIGYFLSRNISKAIGLRLHRRKPIDILDIGCGGGHFLLAVEYLGHRGVGLDVPEASLVNDMAQLFDVDLRHHRMEAGKPLPDIGQFDLITAHSGGWHLKKSGTLFSREEWEFLIKDLVERHLKPGGRVVLNLNHKNYTKGLDLGDRQLFKLVEEYGGTIDKRTIRIPS